MKNINRYDRESLRGLLMQARDADAAVGQRRASAAMNRRSFITGCAIGAMGLSAVKYCGRIVRNALLAIDYNLGPTEDFWVVFSAGLFVTVFLLVNNIFKYREAKDECWDSILDTAEGEGEEEEEE